jgi:hypothetical protein
MSISNEEYYEELMYEAHRLGIYTQTHHLADTIKSVNPHITPIDAYATALQHLTENIYPKCVYNERDTN